MPSSSTKKSSSITSTQSVSSTIVRKRTMVRTFFISRTEIHMSPTIFILYGLFFCLHFTFFFARDTLTLNESISGQHGETLISARERFELGFFRNMSTPSRYMGIWYYRSNPKIIVWVANRDSPLTDDSGVFAISKDGKLEVLDGNKSSHWSPKPEKWVSSKAIVKLLDSGNLVLREGDEHSGSLRVIWQSFNEPTDTFLPGMKMNENLKLISWISPDNPGSGNFTFQLDEDRENHYIIKKGRSIPYWKSGVSGNFIKSNDIAVISPLLSNATGSSVDITKLLPKHRKNDPNNMIPSISDKSYMRFVMNFDGKVQYLFRNSESAPWITAWSEPEDMCSVFKACGDFASCNSKRESLCTCLRGFEPVSPDDWNFKEFSEGCRREKPLCSKDGKDGKIRHFQRLKVMKVGKPDEESEANATECREDCLGRCDCQAYAYDEAPPSKVRFGNSKCWIWSASLNNIEEDAVGGHQIYLGVKPILKDQIYSTMQGGGSRGRETQWTLIVTATIASVSVLACTIAIIYILRKKVKGQEDRESTLPLQYYDSQRHVKDLMASIEFKEEDKKGIDLPFFDFESILAATESFSEANKLGKGGFGPVYKGKFPGGQEIAVKRLSSVTGQGLEEFKNEVLLIARLQHRNLVRLLGYCIEGSEKILLYEYMPNKSLDFFIFDCTLRMLLNWETRFNIILGVARGLLYLHQDSRLRIIHRDLKTSNILLDQEMNPKISDFGLARIFEGTQTEGTTNRVVGTYGYMSPEYALEGFFSVKSDVFSFGVVVLEIISGKRNTGFYNSEQALSLLGYAWKLWQEDKALDVMEKQLNATAKTNEILKCINVALLCVQEDPNDRPTMSNVVIMLSSDTATLLTPKQPAFVLRRGLSSSASSSSKPETNAKLTISLEGR